MLFVISSDNISSPLWPLNASSITNAMYSSRNPSSWHVLETYGSIILVRNLTLVYLQSDLVCAKHQTHQEKVLKDGIVLSCLHTGLEMAVDGYKGYQQQ